LSQLSLAVGAEKFMETPKNVFYDEYDYIPVYWGREYYILDTLGPVGIPAGYYRFL